MKAFTIEDSISVYNNAFSLLLDNAAEELKSWTAEEREALEHIGGYEDYDYFVIDEKTVITADSMSGHVYSTDTLAEFIEGVRKECGEV